MYKTDDKNVSISQYNVQRADRYKRRLTHAVGEVSAADQ